MSSTRTVLFCLGVGAAVVLAAACNGPQPNDEACTSPGGTCVEDTNQCSETLPYPCSSGTCCILHDSGSSAPAPTVTASGD
jgi:hypothetical protein